MNIDQTIVEIYEINRTIKWIRDNNYQKVCLQFPNHLLNDSTVIAQILMEKLGNIVYVLADTSYESCCVDYVAAGHVNADAIVHYGPICFSKTSATLPCLNIFEKSDFDFELFKESYKKKFEISTECPVIVLDTNYEHIKGRFSEEFPENRIISLGDDYVIPKESSHVIFIANNERKLINLKFLNKGSNCYWYNPGDPKDLNNFETDLRIIKRRYFLSEKIKDSCTIGLIIATLSVKNYLKIIEKLKKLLNLHKKKYYLISVGKPNVAKLANFPEIDIYVMITCSLNPIYDSQDYYKPIVTPYDVEMALNPLAKNSVDFSYDFNSFIDNPIPESLDGFEDDLGDVSLVSGRVRRRSTDDVEEGGGGDQLMKFEGTVALNNKFGAGFLSERSWKGLEQNLGENEVKLAEEGRKGIAQGYSHEIKE